MIKIETLGPGVLKIVAPKKLGADDFAAIAPEVDAIIKQQGTVRLLIDASRLEGWDNLAALEKHANFVKGHQDRVERIAVIVRHDWQHWLVGAVKVFLDPEVRVFDRDEEDNALKWILKTRTKKSDKTVSTLTGEPVETLIAEIADGH